LNKDGPTEYDEIEFDCEKDLCVGDNGQCNPEFRNQGDRQGCRHDYYLIFGQLYY